MQVSLAYSRYSLDANCITFFIRLLAFEQAQPFNPSSQQKLKSLIIITTSLKRNALFMTLAEDQIQLNIDVKLTNSEYYWLITLGKAL